jgi:hypothetical protein
MINNNKRKLIIKNIFIPIILDILKREYKISLSDIRAFPLVEKEDLFWIGSELKKSFDLKLETELISSEPFLEWERVIKLRVGEE